MEELYDFYTRFLSSICLDVKDDVIMVGESPLVVNNYPVELYNRDKRYIIDGNVRALVFNLLHENIIKYRNPSKEPITNKILKIIELNLNLTLKGVLVSFIQNQINKVDYNYKVISQHNLFFNNAEACKKSAKQLYDSKMLDLYGSLMGNETKFISLSYRTNVMFEGEEVPSLVLLKHSLLETIEDDEFHGFRRKDKDILQTYLEHLKTLIPEKLSFSIKSEYTVAITLSKLIIKLNELLEPLYLLTVGDSNFVSFFKNNISYSDLKKFKSYYKYSTMLPYIDIDSKKEISYTITDSDDTTNLKVESEVTSNGGNIIKPLSEIVPKVEQQISQQQVIGYDSNGLPIYGNPTQTVNNNMQLIMPQDIYGQAPQVPVYQTNTQPILQNNIQMQQQPIYQQQSMQQPMVIIGYDGMGNPIYGQQNMQDTPPWESNTLTGVP